MIYFMRRRVMRQRPSFKTSDGQNFFLAVRSTLVHHIEGLFSPIGYWIPGTRCDIGTPIHKRSSMRYWDTRYPVQKAGSIVSRMLPSSAHKAMDTYAELVDTKRINVTANQQGGTGMQSANESCFG